MKITKYPQSCLLIETKGKKILIDPGALKYKEEYFEVWNSVDIILITNVILSLVFPPVLSLII